MENNKVINHLLEECKSLSSILQATVSPWLPQNSYNGNSNLNINSPLVCNSFETPTKNPPHTPKNNGEVLPNKLIMNNQLRNNNRGVAPNKPIIDEQLKNNIQEYFSKEQKINKFRKPISRYSQEKASSLYKP